VITPSAKPHTLNNFAEADAAPPISPLENTNKREWQMEIKYCGFCHCGCGKKTNINKKTNISFAYLIGHSMRKNPWDFIPKGLSKEICWEWLGSKSSNGYGFLGIRKAHRISYELFNGPIGEGLFVLHSCDNPPCVNPTHLRLGTPADNHQDMMLKGRNGWCARPGELSASAKISEKEALEIKELYANTNATTFDLADRFKLKFQSIYSIISGKNWKHLKKLENHPRKKSFFGYFKKGTNSKIAPQGVAI
jgi:hypothetical protein